MRIIPPELVERYEREGWWTRETLGDLVANGLRDSPHTGFCVHSAVRPYSGTFADMERDARRLAAGLRSRGVGPGDVVALQLPNWREAALTFWASALLGAVIVPIVHFYGRKELGHILATAAPRVFVTTVEFGRMRYLPDLCADVPVVGLERLRDASVNCKYLRRMSTCSVFRAAPPTPNQHLRSCQYIKMPHTCV